jgi:hypothetical protein
MADVVKLEEFEDTWGQIIEEIKGNQEGLSEKDANNIRLEFEEKSNLFLLSLTRHEQNESIPVLNLLESRLETALSYATSRYKLKHGSIQAKWKASLIGLLIVIVILLLRFLS